MATVLEHSEIVLAGILPHRKDRLDKAMRRLTPEHFSDKKNANIFNMLEKYADKVNAVLPKKYLDDFLTGKVEEAQQLLYVETFEAYINIEISDAEFSWSIEQLRELAAEKATGEVIAEAMEILKRGKEVSFGITLRGHEDARARLMDSISYIDRDVHMVESPEGYIQDDQVEILAEYAERKRKRETGEVAGIGFGIEELDKITGGMQAGELALVAASASNGKSSVATQSTWFAATQQKKSVVFFATETSRAVIRRKLIARHSKLEMFGLPDGLNLRDLRDGNLSPKEEQILQDVTHDLTTNSDYGKIFLSQVGRGDTILSLEHKIERASRNSGVDFVVMDYIALLASLSKNSDERSKQVENLRESKMIATTAVEGLGIPFLSPWQINREGRGIADSSGYYSMQNLSDTSEAEKIADLIISLYRSPEDVGRYAEVVFQVLKNRDGELARDILVNADYGTSTFISKSGLIMPKAVTSSSMMPDQFSMSSLYSSD